MFDASGSIFAANKVMRELGESGSVGYEKTKQTAFATDAVIKASKTFVVLTLPSSVGAFDLNNNSGKLFSVTVNGRTYERESFVLEDDQGFRTGVVGNPSMYNPEYEDTGEPFYLSSMSGGSKLRITAKDPVTLDNSVDVVVSVKLLEKTIHPIDPKYLPGVCLPVVELETVVSADAVFTDAENNALTEAFESGLPVVLKCAINTAGASVEVQAEKFNCIAYGATSDGMAFFMLPGTPTMIALADGVWGVVFE